MEKNYIQQTLNTAFINKTTMPVMLYDFNWTSSRLAIVIIKDFFSESNQKSWQTNKVCKVWGKFEKSLWPESNQKLSEEFIKYIDSTSSMNKDKFSSCLHLSSEPFCCYYRTRATTKDITKENNKRKSDMPLAYVIM